MGDSDFTSKVPPVPAKKLRGSTGAGFVLPCFSGFLRGFFIFFVMWLFLSNWDAIQARNLPGIIGSCTEPMVSRVLSERLSRNPMGRSRAGLPKMVMIRVYCQNGRAITSSDVAGGRLEKDGERKAAACVKKYDAIVKKQFEDALAGAHEWRWFEKDGEISGKRTGTKYALDLLGKMRDIC